MFEAEVVSHMTSSSSTKVLKDSLARPNEKGNTFFFVFIWWRKNIQFLSCPREARSKSYRSFFKARIKMYILSADTNWYIKNPKGIRYEH